MEIKLVKIEENILKNILIFFIYLYLLIEFLEFPENFGCVRKVMKAVYFIIIKNEPLQKI